MQFILLIKAKGRPYWLGPLTIYIYIHMCNYVYYNVYTDILSTLSVCCKILDPFTKSLRHNPNSDISHNSHFLAEADGWLPMPKDKALAKVPWAVASKVYPMAPVGFSTRDIEIR